MLVLLLTFYPLASDDKIENGHLVLKVKLCEKSVGMTGIHQSNFRNQMYCL